MIFKSSISRRYIQIAVPLLVTRVKQPDEDDWGKLKRVLRYLNGARGLKLTLSSDDISVFKLWVDASYAYHEYCKGRTGVIMSLGQGGVTSFSRKQQIQGKISTKCELIAVDEKLPQALWTNYFIEAQGYLVDINLINQDNKSAILIETNGRF